jgi:uncharacterized membrane protein YbhN (UPF0104 family)
VHAFFHAVRIFGDHLAAVRWELLAIGLGIHLVRLALRSYSWRAILLAAYPGSGLKLRTAFGAYVAGVGVNSITPGRGGDLVKLYLIKHRMEGSSYATLAPTLIAETVLDFFVAGALIVWALSIGVLPTHEVYSRLPTVDWKFFLRHEHATGIVLLFAAAAALIAFILVAEHGGDLLARIRQGFAIFFDGRKLFFGVIVPQSLSWVLRAASIYYFLRAFEVPATIHNALLAMVVDSLATLFPATPGGAGTKQGLIVFVFAKEKISSSLLLAFSVGMNIAIVVFNLLLGMLAIVLMARTLSFRRLRVQASGEQAAASGPK